MIIKKGNNCITSIYRCDKCKCELNNKEVYRVEYKRHEGTYWSFKKVKQYDLCRECYAKIHRYIKKG